MKEIYTALAKHLSEKCAFLRTIDIDRGQLNTLYSESSRPEVAFPCLLLRITIRRAIDITPYEQDCEATIQFTYATDRVTETASHFARERQLQGLKPYDEVTSIYNALQGWDCDGAFAPLTRSTEEPLQLHKGIFAERLTFQTQFVQLLAPESEKSSPLLEGVEAMI